ncbi:MAG: hypothetical protein EON93_24655, partial [Burkholderiales bacterium]
MEWVERAECPACGGAGARELYRCGFAAEPLSSFLKRRYKRDPSGLAPALYRVDRCEACGLIYQRSIGDDAFLAMFYSQWLPRAIDPEADPNYARDIKDPPASRDGHELMMAAAYLKKPIEQFRTLDFGMGWGLWTRIAAALGAESHGCELSPECRHYVTGRGVMVT